MTRTHDLLLLWTCANVYFRASSQDGSSGSGGRFAEEAQAARMLEQVVRLEETPQGKIIEIPNFFAQPMESLPRSERPATPLRVPKLPTPVVRDAQLPAPTRRLVLQATVEMPVIFAPLPWEAERMMSLRSSVSCLPCESRERTLTECPMT